jgi:hypothetical protein
MAKQGSGGRTSQQVKVVVPNGANLYGKQNTPPNVGPMTHPAPGANLPKNSPRKPPTLGT